MAKWIRIRDAKIDDEPCHGAWINMDNVSMINPNDRELEMTCCSTVKICSDYDWYKVHELLKDNEIL